VTFINKAAHKRRERLDNIFDATRVGELTLAKRGPGLHHLCVEVADIHATLARLKKQGVKLINETPAPLPTYGLVG
jgi:4-hydroxyphenylpyruvate dioxygenase-like putative hemolysin